jgi:periplasmic protein TonB
MSYANQTQDFRRRATAIAGTVAVHAALGVAVVTGLTIAGYKPVKIYDPPQFPLPKPPEPEPTPSPTASTDPRTPVPPAPMPPLPMPPQPGPETWDPTDEPVDTLPFPDPGPTASPEPPRPSPSFTPRLARPRNQPSGWLSPDDYPRAPLVDGVEGTAAYRLIVGTNGRVSACEVTRSTGNGQLDAATCKFIERRARFEPATDESGAKVVGSYTGTVKWEIPE